VAGELSGGVAQPDVLDPPILASLKSLLETGESLEETRHWPKGF